MSICRLVGSLPEELRKPLVAMAVVRVLNDLLEKHAYGAVMRLAEAAASKGLIPQNLAARIAHQAELIETVEEARRLIEQFYSALRKRDYRTAEILAAEARRLAERVLAAEEYAPPEAWRRLDELAGLLRDLSTILRLYRLSEKAASVIEKLAETLRYYLASIADALRTLDISKLMGLDPRLLEALVEQLPEPGVVPCNSEACTRAVEQYTRLYEEARRTARILARIVAGLALNIANAIGAIRQLQHVIDEIHGGASTYSLRDSYASAVDTLLTVYDRLSRFEEEAGGLPSDIRGVLTSFIESLKTALMNTALQAAEIAKHDDWLWEAVRKVFEAHGWTVRREQKPLETIQRFIEKWVEYYKGIAQYFESQAAKARDVLSRLWAGLNAYLARTAQHFIEFTAGIIPFFATAVATHAKVLGDLLRGRLREASEEEWRFLLGVLRGLMPSMHSIEDFLGWVTALALSAVIMSELHGIAARFRPLRIGRIELRIVDIPALIAPEVELVGRGLSALLERAAAAVARLAREAEEGRVELVQLEQLLDRFELRGAATGPEAARVISERVEELLRDVAPDVAREVASRVAAYLRMLKGPVKLGDVVRAVEKSLEDVGAEATERLVERLVGIRSAADALEKAISEIRRMLAENALYDVRNVERILAKIDEAVEEAHKLIEEARSAERLLKPVFPKLAERLEELSKLLESGELRYLSELRRLIEFTRMYGYELSELKKGLAELVEEYLRDRQLAERIRNAESIVEVYLLALKPLEEGAPLRILEEYVRRAKSLVRRVEEVLSKYATAVGASLRTRFVTLLKEEAAKARLFRVSELPEPLRRILEEAGVHHYATAMDLAWALAKLAEEAEKAPGSAIYAMRLAVERIGRLVEDAERLLEEMGNRELAERLREEYLRARAAIERRVMVEYERLRPVREALSEMAEALRRIRMGDVARLLEEAAKALEKLDERRARRLLSHALVELVKRARGRPDVAAAEIDLLTHYERMLARFAPEVVRALREIESAGGLAGVAVRIERYTYTPIRALDREALETLKALLRPGIMEEIEVGGLRFRVEKWIEARPGETILNVKVWGPGGYWAHARIIFRIVREDGREFVDVAHIIDYDPRIKGTPLQSILDLGLERAVERTMERLGRRIAIVTPAGRLELLEATLRAIIQRLGEEIPPLIRLLASAGALRNWRIIQPFLTPPPPGVSRSVQPVSPNEIRIAYTVAGKSFTITLRLAPRPELEVTGSIEALLEALRRDMALRRLLENFAPTPSRIATLKGLVPVTIDGLHAYATPNPAILVLAKGKLRYLNLPDSS